MYVEVFHGDKWMYYLVYFMCVCLMFQLLFVTLKEDGWGLINKKKINPTADMHDPHSGDAGL